MSGQTDPKTTQERADRTSDENVETAVEGTFPASDPMATIASQGARAVPPEELMGGAGDATPQSGAVALTARFESAEAAKLALEAMVREGPVDRNCAEVEAGDGGAGAILRIAVPRSDQGRLGEMLQRQPGRTG
jgi:hypothetical protein